MSSKIVHPMDKPRSKRVIDLTGKVFGRLTVKKYAGNGVRGMAIWWCECSCTGRMVSVKGKNLIAGLSESCGCIRKERQHEAVSLPPGEAKLRNMMSLYRRGAKLRSLDFSLSAEQFSDLIKRNCTYCDAPPAPRYNSQKSNKYIFSCNGIDRLNPDLGYISGNCVPCCKTCNSMKSDMSFIQFFKHIHKIVRAKGYLWLLKEHWARNYSD